jgi:hypothetical protein
MQDAVYSPGAREAPPPMATRTKKKPAEVTFTNLKAEIARHTHVEAGLPPATWHRWKSGEIPAAIRWLARNPRMLAALIRDVEAAE